jgi:hypothetical protein
VLQAQRHRMLLAQLQLLQQGLDDWLARTYPGRLQVASQRQQWLLQGYALFSNAMSAAYGVDWQLTVAAQQQLEVLAATQQQMLAKKFFFCPAHGSYGEGRCTSGLGCHMLHLTFPGAAVHGAVVGQAEVALLAGMIMPGWRGAAATATGLLNHDSSRGRSRSRSRS